jgi:hypothetical protein
VPDLTDLDSPFEQKPPCSVDICHDKINPAE